MTRHLRRDGGSIFSALVFILLATGLVASMVGFYLIRSSTDYVAAQSAQVKSAITQLSTKLLGQLNNDFPSDWLTDSSSELASATLDLSTSVSSSASATVTYFAINSQTGVVSADVSGQSGTDLNVKLSATVQFVPSGAGVFMGIDSNERPTWVYSNANLDSLALWEMNPSAVIYIDPNGDYDVVSPADQPTVSLAAAAAGADGTVGGVYCRFGATPQYQTQNQISPASSYSAWSAWAATATPSFTLAEGAQLNFQARARCVSDTESSAPSIPSTATTYLRPITTTPAAPVVSATTAGVVGWTAVACPDGTAAQYAHREHTNNDPWSNFSAWSTARTFTTTIPVGGVLESEVKARCASDFAAGPGSPVTTSTTISDALTAPAAPTVTLTGSVHLQVTPSVCTTGTTTEARWRFAIDGAKLSDAPWDAWGESQQFDPAVGVGQRLSAEAQQRCSTPFTSSPLSPTSGIAVRDVPITTAPILADIAIGANSFTWSDALCPSSTIGQYQWSWSINGGASVTSGSTWQVRPVSVPLALNEGSSVAVSVSGVCAGYAANGPSASRTASFDRPVITAPTVVNVSVDSAGAAAWSAADCTDGTSLQYQWQYARNGGGWGAFSAWGTSVSANGGSNAGDSVAYQVGARCVSTSTGVVGPSDYDTGSVIRGIPTPDKPVGLSANGEYLGINWNGASCQQGTVGYYSVYVRSADDGVFFQDRVDSPSWFHTGAPAADDSIIYYDLTAYCHNLASGEWSAESPVTTAYWVEGGTDVYPIVTN